MKNKKSITVGDKQINPAWKSQRQEVAKRRDVSSWLFSVYDLLRTPKYRVCKSIDGDKIKWKYSKGAGKIKIYPTNTFPYISPLSSFVSDYVDEILHDKKRRPRVVALKDSTDFCFGTLVIQCLKSEEDGLEVTWLEINIADIDEFGQRP